MTKNSIKYTPSVYLAASLVKELRYCNNHAYVWQVENTTPQRGNLLPSQTSIFYHKLTILCYPLVIKLPLTIDIMGQK